MKCFVEKEILLDHSSQTLTSTNARTWIHTPLSHASLISRTFGINCALWSTVRWGADIICLAWAYCSISYDLTFRIRSARTWIAWIHFRWWFVYDFGIATCERISSETVCTTADRIVIDDLTFGIACKQLDVTFSVLPSDHLKQHLLPHVPGQGSTHFWLRQACSNGQSPLDRHSGRHDGGLPIIPGKHVHTGIPFGLIRQSAFCPQKPHGSFCTSGSSFLQAMKASPT